MYDQKTAEAMAYAFGGSAHAAGLPPLPALDRTMLDWLGTLRAPFDNGLPHLESWHRGWAESELNRPLLKIFYPGNSQNIPRDPKVAARHVLAVAAVQGCGGHSWDNPDDAVTAAARTLDLPRYVVLRFNEPTALGRFTIPAGCVKTCRQVAGYGHQFLLATREGFSYFSYNSPPRCDGLVARESVTLLYAGDDLDAAVRTEADSRPRSSSTSAAMKSARVVPGLHVDWAVEESCVLKGPRHLYEQACKILADGNFTMTSDGFCDPHEFLIVGRKKCGA